MAKLGFSLTTSKQDMASFWRLRGCVFSSCQYSNCGSIKPLSSESYSSSQHLRLVKLQNFIRPLTCAYSFLLLTNTQTVICSLHCTTSSVKTSGKVEKQEGKHCRESCLTNTIALYKQLQFLTYSKPQ